MKALVWPATAILCAFIVAVVLALNGRYRHEGEGQLWVIDTWTGTVCLNQAVDDQGHFIGGAPADEVLNGKVSADQFLDSKGHHHCFKP